MKKFFARFILIAVGLAFVSVLVYVAALVAHSDDPHGKYASFEFFPHARTDVLRFEGGKVRLETCCGDEDYGSYKKDSSGRWIWTYQQELRPADRSKWRLTPPKAFVLRRSLFQLVIESLDTPDDTLSMRRRLFNDVPL